MAEAMSSEMIKDVACCNSLTRMFLPARVWVCRPEQGNPYTVQDADTSVKKRIVNNPK